MKKKFVKSDLTARERKRLREKQAAVSSGQSERLTAEEYEKKAPRVRVFAIAAIVAAVILIAVGITVPLRHGGELHVRAKSDSRVRADERRGKV